MHMLMPLVLVLPLALFQEVIPAPPDNLGLWVAAINTLGVILVLAVALRAFLRHDVNTKAEMTERLAEKDEERKRVEVDRDAWRAAATTALANNDRILRDHERHQHNVRDDT